MEHSVKYCRLCLREGATNLSPRSDSTDSSTETEPNMIILNGNMELLDRILAFTSLELLRAPSSCIFYLCRSCEKILENFNSFRNQCQLNDQIYRTKFYPHENSGDMQIKTEPLCIDSDVDIKLEQYPESLLTSEAQVTDSDSPGVVTVLNSELDVHGKYINLEVQYACDACGKPFKFRAQLKNYRQLRRLHKPFDCSECGKAFSQRFDLNRHFRTHTGERPYECEVCKKKFVNLNHRTRHMLTHQTEKPCHCTVCDKTFRHLDYLRDHMRLHTGEKPYSCDICGKKFTNAGILRKHLPSHLRLKPFECEVCEKKFALPQQLARHARTHSKRYECTRCNIVFEKSGSLKKHLKEHEQ